jgi:hypothetical protein
LRVPEKLSYLRTLLYALRIVAGIFIIALLLLAASRTTRDCTVGLYVYDICAWVWLREQLGLPASKLLRAVFLELIGLTLTVGIFLTIRFVLPFWRTGTSSQREGEESRSSGSP